LITTLGSKLEISKRERKHKGVKLNQIHISQKVPYKMILPSLILRPLQAENKKIQAKQFGQGERKGTKK